MSSQTFAVPESLRSLVLMQKGQVLRTAKDAARTELSSLGVRVGCELHSFFSEFQIGFFQSHSSDEELCDICEPTPEIATGTAFVQDVWELPKEFICLTGVQGEGCYLYSNKTEAVYDFSLEDRTSFIENPQPRWGSFFEFMDWYLAPDVENAR